MLGWDVGTFEFTSPRILALNYFHHAAIKMRTGGSSGRIGKTQARKLEEGDGFYWDLTKKEGKNDVKLPVKYRYRSPVIFELHIANHRKPDGYAMLWLQNLIDNEDTPINLPIWQTKNGARLTQNYMIEEADPAKEVGLGDLTEIGRLQFRGRFKSGTDESHEAFITDNNTRETFETWEACLAEGVRQRQVDKETPDRVQQLHDDSLTEGRDVLKNADPREKQRWLTRDGTDWSGAFSHDPKAYMDSKGNKAREPGAEPPLHDPYNPSSDDDTDDEDDKVTEGSNDHDFGIQDGTNMNRHSRGQSQSMDVDRRSMVTDGTGRRQSTASSTAISNRQNKHTEERKQRGLMQWKPARNAKFAKDESVIGLRKMKNKLVGGLDGRKPDVETEA